MADRGLSSSAPLARLAPTGVQAVRHVAARQMVDFTPGRPLVTPGGRRTPAVQGGPRSRWLTALAHLETTRRMDLRHGQTVPGVLQELTVCALVDNLGRLVRGHSARLPHIHVERIRCLDALRWRGAPPTGLSRRALRVHPIRPQRVEPPVKKRRPQSFPLMITPRHARRQQLVHQEVRA